MLPYLLTIFGLVITAALGYFAGYSVGYAAHRRETDRTYRKAAADMAQSHGHGDQAAALRRARRAAGRMKLWADGNGEGRD